MAGFFFRGINGIGPSLDSSQAKSDNHKKNTLTKKYNYYTVGAATQATGGAVPASESETA